MPLYLKDVRFITNPLDLEWLNFFFKHNLVIEEVLFPKGFRNNTCMLNFCAH